MHFILLFFLKKIVSYLYVFSDKHTSALFRDALANAVALRSTADGPEAGAELERTLRNEAVAAATRGVPAGLHCCVFFLCYF